VINATPGQMPRLLVISAGMPRAGSAWYFHLTHDLWKAVGGTDVHVIRNQFHLQNLMTEVNCNMGSLGFRRLLPVMRPLAHRQSFVVKTHSRPYLFSKIMIRAGYLKPTYIFRDPRDALLSAFEYGQRVQRDLGRPNAFSSISSIEDGINWIQKHLRVWEAWSRTPGTLLCRYEDLLSDYDGEVARLAQFLGLDLNISKLSFVIEKYRPQQPVKSGEGLHFYKGQKGRFREVFTSDQQQLALSTFGEYLDKMGFSP
jgi:hypothetical protein